MKKKSRINFEDLGFWILVIALLAAIVYLIATGRAFK